MRFVYHFILKPYNLDCQQLESLEFAPSTMQKNTDQGFWRRDRQTDSKLQYLQRHAAQSFLVCSYQYRWWQLNEFAAKKTGNGKKGNWKKGNGKKRQRKLGYGKIGQPENLPNFPVAQFSVAHFSGCRFFHCSFFPLALFLTLIVCCLSLPSYFSLPNFPVAQFSRSPIFRCRFSVAFFLVAPFTVRNKKGAICSAAEISVSSVRKDLQEQTGLSS